MNQTAIFAMGCFWQPDELFRVVPGVLATEVGYTGGRTANPTYKEVCYTDTGHAEAVKITFDPQAISYRRLLEIFWNNHDPTTLNQQGPDFGEQYRSAIFALDEAQMKEALASRDQAAREQVWGKRPIVTQILAAGPWWSAEDYHQKYLQKRGISQCHLPHPPSKPLVLAG